VPELDLMINEKMKITDIDIVKKWLNVTLQILEWEKNDFKSVNDVKNIFVEKIKEAEMKNGQVLWPTRYALSWEKFSPGALEMIYILWINKSEERIKKVLKNI
jgi:glutamyl/glutaminyl-tRNA synthetase